MMPAVTRSISTARFAASAALRLSAKPEGLGAGAFGRSAAVERDVREPVNRAAGSLDRREGPLSAKYHATTHSARKTMAAITAMERDGRFLSSVALAGATAGDDATAEGADGGEEAGSAQI